jgi:hypothetical protein
MSHLSTLALAAALSAVPNLGVTDTLTFTKTDAFFAPHAHSIAYSAPPEMSLIDHHKHARVYLPVWDVRSLKMEVPWDIGYDMPIKPRSLSLLNTSGNVYWQTHLRPEPAAPASARLAAVSLPASAGFMSLALFALWMGANARKTQALRRRYN